MPDRVIVTVVWSIKPEYQSEFVRTLSDMFSTTKIQRGFRSIRLLKSDIDRDGFILVQEWDSTQDHQAYAKFRADRGDVKILSDMCSDSPQIGYWNDIALAEARV